MEAIRALMADGRSARSERVQAINQARALIVTGPGDLRARFARHAAAALVSELAALRPRPGGAAGYATRIALRELGRLRCPKLSGQGSNRILIWKGTGSSAKRQNLYS